jgi:hypothetical protein
LRICACAHREYCKRYRPYWYTCSHQPSTSAATANAVAEAIATPTVSVNAEANAEARQVKNEKIVLNTKSKKDYLSTKMLEHQTATASKATV